MKCQSRGQRHDELIKPTYFLFCLSSRLQLLVSVSETWGIHFAVAFALHFQGGMTTPWITEMFRMTFDKLFVMAWSILECSLFIEQSLEQSLSHNHWKDDPQGTSESCLDSLLQQAPEAGHTGGCLLCIKGSWDEKGAQRRTVVQLHLFGSPALCCAVICLTAASPAVFSMFIVPQNLC